MSLVVCMSSSSPISVPDSPTQVGGQGTAICPILVDATPPRAADSPVKVVPGKKYRYVCAHGCFEVDLMHEEDLHEATPGVKFFAYGLRKIVHSLFDEDIDNEKNLYKRAEEVDRDEGEAWDSGEQPVWPGYFLLNIAKSILSFN